MSASYSPIDLPAWSVLKAHHAEIRSQQLRVLFETDPSRFERFSVEDCGLLLDYSKNRITEATMTLLIGLAEEAHLASWIARLFGGEIVNPTENRAALHPALRAPDGTSAEARAIQAELEHMRGFATCLQTGQLAGSRGRVITDVVNIGIGGSDLGVTMAIEALVEYRAGRPRIHCVAGADGIQLANVLDQLEPETTLFIVCSKSFTTAETLANARAAKDWLGQRLPEEEIAAHFVGVSANPQRMSEFGVARRNQFMLPDAVGGRYSLCSTAGIALALAVGMQNFEGVLRGAHAMDTHFLNAEAHVSLPVILGLLDVWYVNFFGVSSRAIVPYDQRLSRFPAYLQQLEMESNGKRVTRDGEPARWDTAPVIWGDIGPGAQHSFFQLLHQGTRMIPVDFIAAARGVDRYDEHREAALAACLAQSRALMLGRTEAEAEADLHDSGLAAENRAKLTPHKIHPGNRPSNTILFERLDPETLGKLIALYEHKVFVQSVIWGINPFDQWGVELGKKLAGDVLPVLQGAPDAAVDSSTRGLAAYLKRSTGRGLDS